MHGITFELNDEQRRFLERAASIEHTDMSTAFITLLDRKIRREFLLEAFSAPDRLYLD